MPAHAEMLQQILKGIDMEEGATVILLDMIPNKTFARRLFTFQLLHISVARRFWNNWSFLLLLQITSNYFIVSLIVAIWNCPETWKLKVWCSHFNCRGCAHNLTGASQECRMVPCSR